MVLFVDFVYFLLFQAVIDANIFPALIEILRQAEFKTRKEAAWAITNATSGGSHDQIRYKILLLSQSLKYVRHGLFQ